MFRLKLMFFLLLQNLLVLLRIGFALGAQQGLARCWFLWLGFVLSEYYLPCLWGDTFMRTVVCLLAVSFVDSEMVLKFKAKLK